MDPLSLLWLFFILASMQPAFQRQVLMTRRRYAMAAISRKRQTTVISLIHRQESMSLFGFPIVRFIDIDDAEGILRAIQETPQGRSIEIILHTPGGMVLAAQQIASALADHDGRVTAVVPHYAMSGGTLIAMAADEILIDAHSALGPVDPQLGEFPAASLVEVSEMPGDHEDKTLLLADVGRKALVQVESFVTRLLAKRMPPDRAAAVAQLLATGRWTHDHPLLARDLALLGLPVKVGVPEDERELMTLYPQPRGRTSPVEYVPVEPGMPNRRARQ
ncbi:SDH family Clp fold serine proteinase [Candidatus Solirubrobacter pratensis]|uniref:SDH family Clp fold serine proteinase n=1 Tax=Candidatus Solirubrobacter pratensis TaxID=1298857 RepID=UPI000421D3F6|nr:ATP-dependent Clp protease proteolytic subunit [Candidatus Solirubrobacter pratensis]